MFSGFFSAVGGAATKAFDWMGSAGSTIGTSIKNNPDAWKLGASLVGGAATGYMNAKTAKDQMKFQERMLAKQMAQAEKFKERRASTGDNYDSHTNNLVGGTGLLAPAMYGQPR